MKEIKQKSYKLRELENLLKKAREGLLYDCSEKAVLNKIKELLRIWDKLEEEKE